MTFLQNLSPFLQAPMAGYTCYAQRRIVRQLGGAGTLATEMVSARGMLAQEERGEEPMRLYGVADEPKPVVVQIWDNNPAALASVAKEVASTHKATAVDINFGCPARNIAEKAESGAYLLGDPDRVGEIVATVVQACKPTPVTAKIRLGLDHENITAPEVAKAVEQAGAVALAVHGRTAADKYRGTADWKQIAALRDVLQNIPLIGNGDLITPEEMVAALNNYPVDAVMVGRAALAKPWIFKQAVALWQGEEPVPDPTDKEFFDILHQFLGYLIEQYGEQRGVVLFRNHACRMVRGHRGARTFRERVSTAKTCEEVKALLLETIVAF